MIYREHQRGLYASERPGVDLRNLMPGRSSYPVIVSLTPPTTLNQDPTARIRIVTGKDAPTAKHRDAQQHMKKKMVLLQIGKARMQCRILDPAREDRTRPVMRVQEDKDDR
ncbi:hypothetical protein ASG92_25105 [Arthrobacter sp. Soil736]|uniref:hypothetical protein n=1 Tax=Arthrobacter sp. Soil736 TaxID=1736395 RepID=UPI000700A317|nr:hypothetical protein [Arthrobacter sp. Soil736]KRE52950.1 hypothetical protein ASG92_25105 [Arthrobacter sp. Soil736]